MSLAVSRLRESFKSFRGVRWLWDSPQPESAKAKARGLVSEDVAQGHCEGVEAGPEPGPLTGNCVSRTVLEAVPMSAFFVWLSHAVGEVASYSFFKCLDSKRNDKHIDSVGVLVDLCWSFRDFPDQINSCRGPVGVA